MQRTEIRVNVSSAAELRSLFDRELRHHRTFVNGRFDLQDREACALVLVHPTGRIFTIPAEAVYLKRDDPGAGAGLDLVGLDSALLKQLERFVSEPVTTDGADALDNAGGNEGDARRNAGGAGDEDRSRGANEPDNSGESREADETAVHDDTVAALGDAGSDLTDPDAGSEASDSSNGNRLPRNVHERVRQLSLREREAISRSGTLVERVALERAFGGSVWEGLLQNPQLTAPEVARIAKNGSLPMPLVSVIVANANWLASAEVRRALIGNPRVTGLNLDRTLRAFPRNELKQMAQMSGYRRDVREGAQRIVGK